MRNMQCAKFKVQSKDMDILQYTFFQNALIGVKRFDEIKA